jgi:hypothetical protein
VHATVFIAYYCPLSKSPQLVEDLQRCMHWRRAPPPQPLVNAIYLFMLFTLFILFWKITERYLHTTKAYKAHSIHVITCTYKIRYAMTCYISNWILFFKYLSVCILIQGIQGLNLYITIHSFLNKGHCSTTVKSLFVWKHLFLL